MLFSHCPSPMILVVRFTRSITKKSNVHLVNQMKIYNDQCQYRQTLQLFDKHKDDIQLNTNYSSSIFSQVLKACSKLNEFELGSRIHQQIKSTLIINDSFVLQTL